MAYTSGDTILDDHYNGFATSVNSVWGTGSGDSGYGQTSTVSAVAAGNTVTAAQWTTLLARISSMASHQGSSITAISNPSAGTTISAFAAISTNITTVTNNRLNVASRQGVVTGNVSTATNLTGTITQTGHWAFPSEAQARYFFNAGGRMSCTWALSGGTGYSKYNQWVELTGPVGTYYIYAQTSGKSGGSGTANINDTNAGWHDLTGSYVTVFRQYEDTGPYTANRIDLNLYKTGANVYWQTQWIDDAPENEVDGSGNVTGTKTFAMKHERPAVTYISDTWGTITHVVDATG